jgi:hypothetical protein
VVFLTGDRRDEGPTSSVAQCRTGATGRSQPDDYERSADWRVVNVHRRATRYGRKAQRLRRGYDEGAGARCEHPVVPAGRPERALRTMQKTLRLSILSIAHAILERQRRMQGQG